MREIFNHEKVEHVSSIFMNIITLKKKGQNPTCLITVRSKRKKINVIFIWFLGEKKGTDREILISLLFRIIQKYIRTILYIFQKSALLSVMI